MKSIFALITILVTVGLTQADAPSEVSLRMSGDTVIVSALHKSKKTKKHYVNQITVSINGTEVKTKQFTGQNSEEGQNTDIILPRKVEAGDVITATARCNKFGEASGTLTIPEAELTVDTEEIAQEVFEEPIEKVDLNDQIQLSTEEIDEELLAEEEAILEEEISAGEEILEE